MQKIFSFAKFSKQSEKTSSALTTDIPAIVELDLQTVLSWFNNDCFEQKIDLIEQPRKQFRANNLEQSNNVCKFK